MGKDAAVKSKPAEAEAPKAEKAERAEKTYAIDVLRKDCVKLFGISTSTFDGAFYGRKGSYSVSGAKEIINNWKKEVAK